MNRLDDDTAEGPEAARSTIGGMKAAEVEFIFEPDPDGGYHAFAPELPGLHTEGDTLEEALSNAEEALGLYIESLRDEGRSMDMGVVRRTLPLPA